VNTPVPDVTPDPPGRAWRAFLAVLGRLPQASLSRGLGALADVPLPRSARRPTLHAFARVFGIDVAEAELPLDEYRTVNAFFVRKLRPGLRSWPVDPEVLACPVDGILGQLGEISAGRLVQAKGRSYRAAELILDEHEAKRYQGGSFLTLYLSPRHYHRVHAPCGGAIATARHVPGALLPVNAAAVKGVQNLFARNERLMCFVDGPVGRVAVVAVGAYNVGRISAAFDPEWSGPGGRWVTNRRQPPPAERRYDPPVRIEPGQELMAFHLGSTVVLLLEPGRARLDPGLEPGLELRLGSPLARPLT
jgi:phosphatidylserine decarboxylase